MPHLNHEIDPNIGPVVPLLVGVSLARRDALIAAALPVPELRSTRALVDTGASGVCIDPAIVRELGLMPTGSTQVVTPSTRGTPVQLDQYDVTIYLVHQPSQETLELTTPAVEAVLSTHQNFEMIIGREVLSRCLFVYDGQASRFVLAF